MNARKWLLTLAVVGSAASLIWFFPPWQTLKTASQTPNLSQETLQQIAAQMKAIEAGEAAVAQSAWAPELAAQRCGTVFENFWDALNATSNKFPVLRSFSFKELTLPALAGPQPLGQGIELYTPNRRQPKFSSSGWFEMLAKFETAGWSLVQAEFRHNQYEPGNFPRATPMGKAGERSVFYLRADWINTTLSQRAMLEGDLIVDWAPQSSDEGYPLINHLDASHLRLLVRTGTPPFQRVLIEEIRPVDKSHFIDPLILYDLDGDGLSEIILAAKNLVFKRGPNGSYTQQMLCRHPPGLILTGILGDFDGDGAADFLCAKFEGLVLYKGSRRGTFDEPGQLVWTASPRLKYAQALTCGDIDQDGDLDVWLGQYKNPYERGQMPTPYYDANDGNPSYLLINDGHGRFTDGTAAAGLEKKRMRRCYSASLADLNGDGHLDLLTISDFAGADVYMNDGQGHFQDMTESWLPERHGFGMGHALADVNVDGYQDILMLGMHCPTAQRLDHLGLKRQDRPDYDAMRPIMTTGNHLFLGQKGGQFRADTLGESIRRSGWSWGCTVFDWDNDGFPDVYVVNGHETRQTVKDYEPEFWLHDIYVGDSRDDLVKSVYFGAKIARTRGHGYSYGGYEKNRLFHNQGGKEFIEAGHLLGVALELDSRNLAADDLDGDGRVDLVLTTFEVWPKARQTLQVFQNQVEGQGNWIGFRLREQGRGISPVGAVVTVNYAGKTVARQIITGDSHRSQHAPVAHFGLGQNTRVESVEVRWLNGRILRQEKPAINRYHDIISP